MTWSFPVKSKEGHRKTSFTLDNELEDSEEEEQEETQLQDLQTNEIGQVQVGLPEIIPQEQQILQMPQVLQVQKEKQLTFFQYLFIGGRQHRFYKSILECRFGYFGRIIR